MQPELTPKPSRTTQPRIGDVAGIREQTLCSACSRANPFWVAVALLVLVRVMTWLEPSFGTVDNIDQHHAQLSRRSASWRSA